MKENIEYIIERIGLFFRRFGYGKGFGVQSPWAFSLVTKVICKKLEEPLKTHFKNTFPLLSLRERKLTELYFKLACHFNTPQWVIIGDKKTHLKHYLSKANYVQGVIFLPSIAHFEKFQSHSIPCVYLLNHKEINIKMLDEILKNIHPESFFIIPNIYKEFYQKTLFKHLESSPITSVSFDLYYCALVFCKQKLQKQTHWIYF